MTEKKDMHSSPVRASKLQLAVEQPQREGCWTPPKGDTSCPKTKKPQWDGRRSTNMIKSNPISVRWWPTNWRTITSKTISHSCEGSKPHVRRPSLGSWQRDWESPGNLTVKASRLWLQDSHRTGKQRPHCWEGTNKIVRTPRSRGKEQWPHGRLNQADHYCWRVSCGGGGQQWLFVGTSPGRCPWCESS